MTPSGSSDNLETQAGARPLPAVLKDDRDSNSLGRRPLANSPVLTRSIIIVMF